MLAWIYNYAIMQVESEGPQVLGKLGPHSENLSKDEKKIGG